ncbi:hypothetical protein Tco_0940390 [Tanacetum coccineum]|uniref:Uncharacterized protein n=1 Tax=Tanacetum coccineum TaxID=301880 RepID=A0ABQ5DNH3_9ASTR
MLYLCFWFKGSGKLVRANLQTMGGGCGTISTRATAFQEGVSRRGECFSDFLVLEFILMRVLKSGKDVRRPDFCSFFCPNVTSKFLELKDPPHQSWS